jgi:cytochrome oxidase assembly protein ShyY1
VLRLLLQPRWIALVAALLVVVLPGCYLAGRWQLDRYDARKERNAHAEANLTAPAVPVTDLAPAEGALPSTVAWRTVTATGRYDVARQKLLRNRPHNGRTGFHVLTPLVTADGTAVLVNRGWVEAGRTATAQPEVPAPPSGEVQVTGRLRPVEGASGHDRGGLPAGQLARIDGPAIAATLPYPLRAGYVEAVDELPGPPRAPERIKPPDLGVGPHLAYGIQWWLFGLIAVIGVIMLFRRELHDLQDQGKGRASGEGGRVHGERARVGVERGRDA